ncbi:MAG: 4Fe-4S binding protein [Pseudomonadota bacterium]
MSGRPALDGDRCVHARIETASCRACVDACPRRAWRLDDDGLSLDEAACDGCGLCVAACPLGAIGGLALQPARRRVAGREVLLARCDRVTGEDGEGRPACLHGIGLMPLLEAWRQGQRIWLVAAADCAACPRGAGERLETRVERLNGLFQARGLAPIHLRRLGPESLDTLLAGSDTPAADPPPDPRKRSWLGLSPEPAHAPEKPPPAPGAYFTGKGPLPWTLRLDSASCVACHACVRVCPNGALSQQDLVEPPHGGPASLYRLDSARCTGCHLCRDVCEHDALHLTPWTRPTQDTVYLRTKPCPACGTRFHYPADRPNPPIRCWVCAGGKPAGRLYQVME